MSASGPRSADRFPSTHWSEVREAGGDDRTASRAALEGLLRRYLPALRAYVMKKRGLREDAADEVLQGFVARKVLDAEFVAAADRQRGKFRTFLLTALDRFMIDEFRRERARGHGRVVALEDEEGTLQGPAAPGHADAFDLAWARQVIEETLRRMREQCRSDGREDLWGLFDVRVVGPTMRGEGAPAYEQLVRRFGYASPTQASNALVTAKRMFERVLRGVVGEYAGGSPLSVEGELRDLREILSRCGAGSG